MANWANPTVTSPYTDYTTEFRDRDLDVAKGMDPAVVTVTNPVANMIRWNSANRFWELFSGASWGALATHYLIEVGAFTGDVTKAAGASALTIGADKVLNTMLRNSAALSVIGRSVNSSGDPADITAGADDRLLTRVASVLDFTQLTVGMFPAGVVTYAKLQNVTTDKLLGRDTAGSGVVEEIAVGGGVEFSGATAIQRSALSGDVSAPAGSNTTTLASVLSAGGPTGSGSVVPVITWDAKGRLTAVTTAAIPAPGETNTGSNLGTGIGTFDSKSGVDLRMRSVIGASDQEDGGPRRIVVTQSGSDIVVTKVNVASVGSSIHPDSSIEMAGGNRKWLCDIRLGDVVRGRDGMATVLGIWRTTLGDRALWDVNGVVCTPGHLFWTPKGWAAASPEAYAKSSHGKRRVVKGTGGFIETHCLLADPATLPKIDLETQILSADGSWQKVTTLGRAETSGTHTRMTPQQEMIALFLHGSDLFYADGYGVATLA